MMHNKYVSLKNVPALCGGLLDYYIDVNGRLIVADAKQSRQPEYAAAKASSIGCLARRRPPEKLIYICNSGEHPGEIDPTTDMSRLSNILYQMDNGGLTPQQYRAVTDTLNQSFGLSLRPACLANGPKAKIAPHA